MLETLLESRSKRERSAGGVMVSVTAHTALIAIAVYATAQAHVHPAGTREIVRAVYFPRERIPAQPGSTVASPQRRFDIRRVRFVAPDVDIKVPSVDITPVVSKPGDFSPAPILSVGSNDGREGGGNSGGEPFRAEQVEKQVGVVAGSAPPRYPEVLRSSGVEGKVIAQFVVDEQGRVEEGSLRFLRSDNRLFEDAVRVTLVRMRFIPAEIGGVKVRQLVQMPFVFTLSR